MPFILAVLLAATVTANTVQYEVTIDGNTHGIAYDAPATAVGDLCATHRLAQQHCDTLADDYAVWRRRLAAANAESDRGVALMNAGRHEEAEAAFRRAIANTTPTPGHSLARFNLAFLLRYHLGRADGSARAAEAEAAHRAAARAAAADDPRAHFALGVLLRRWLQRDVEAEAAPVPFLQRWR